MTDRPEEVDAMAVNLEEGRRLLDTLDMYVGEDRYGARCLWWRPRPDMTFEIAASWAPNWIGDELVAFAVNNLRPMLDEIAAARGVRAAA